MASWLKIVIYFSAWAVVHSLLATLMMKEAASKLFGPWIDRWYRILYILIALATGVPWLLTIIREPGNLLYRVPEPWNWVFRLVQVAGFLIVFRAVQISNPRSFLGFSQLRQEQPRLNEELSTGGLYRFSRHPMYLGSLLLLWFSPGMTESLLALCVCITGYFFLGSIHEEKLLIHEFGEAYRRYRRKKGRIIPFIP